MLTAPSTVQYSTDSLHSLRPLQFHSFNLPSPYRPPSLFAISSTLTCCYTTVHLLLPAGLRWSVLHAAYCTSRNFSLLQAVLDIPFWNFLPPSCRESSGILAALTSEASQFVTLIGAIALCCKIKGDISECDDRRKWDLNPGSENVS